MEKTEEQIAKEKEAVAAMKNARANMDAALDRIERLERALRSASDTIGTLKDYIGTNTYTYGDGRKLCRSVASDAQKEIAGVLG